MRWRALAHGLLLANLLQSSRSTFSRGNFPSFFAFQEGMWDTPISALGGSPTVPHDPGLSTAYENRGAIFRRVSLPFLRHYHTFGLHYMALQALLASCRARHDVTCFWDPISSP